jgi:hypothetical protein
MTIQTKQEIFFPLSEMKVMLALAIEQHYKIKVIVDDISFLMMAASESGYKLETSPRQTELYMPTTSSTV